MAESNSFDITVRQLIENSCYAAMEDEIADTVNNYVNRKYLSACLKFINDEIGASGFTNNQVRDWLVENKVILKKFSQKWLLSSVAGDEREEYPADESESDSATNTAGKNVKLGLSPGYLVNFSIYLMLLQRDPNGAGLKSYLRKRRIPHAAISHKEIMCIWSEIS